METEKEIQETVERSGNLKVVMMVKKSTVFCSNCGNNLSDLGMKEGDECWCIPNQGHYEDEDEHSQLAEDLGGERAVATKKKLREVV